jgi:Bacterial type II and III secretion system protein
MEPRPARTESTPIASVRGACVVGAILALMITGASAEERLLEVIALQHRLVREMIPVLQPLLAEGGTLTGTSNRLIVRTTRENLAEIREVIVSLDTAIKQLKITVTQDLNAVANFDRDAVAGTIEAGDIGAQIPDTLPDGGVTVGVEGEHGNVQYHGTRSRTQEDSRNLHYVYGMDGQPAFIATGQQIPSPYYNESVTPYGGQVNSGVGYQDVSSGVYVTPRLQGDRVTLDVEPRLERADPYGSGVVDTHTASTTVSGRLGEWIALGGANTVSGGVDSELLARTRRQGDNSYTVWVKVEEQP